MLCCDRRVKRGMLDRNTTDYRHHRLSIMSVDRCAVDVITEVYRLGPVAARRPSVQLTSVRHCHRSEATFHIHGSLPPRLHTAPPPESTLQHTFTYIREYSFASAAAVTRHTATTRLFIFISAEDGDIFQGKIKSVGESWRAIASLKFFLG